MVRRRKETRSHETAKTPSERLRVLANDLSVYTHYEAALAIADDVSALETRHANLCCAVRAFTLQTAASTENGETARLAWALMNMTDEPTTN